MIYSNTLAILRRASTFQKYVNPDQLNKISSLVKQPERIRKLFTDGEVQSLIKKHIPMEEDLDQVKAFKGILGILSDLNKSGKLFAGLNDDQSPSVSSEKDFKSIPAVAPKKDIYTAPEKLIYDSGVHSQFSYTPAAEKIYKNIFERKNVVNQKELERKSGENAPEQSLGTNVQIKNHQIERLPVSNGSFVIPFLVFSVCI